MPDVLWTMYMKIIDKIRLIFKNNSTIETNKIVVLKSCPHCTSRGMFVFKDNLTIKTKIGESNETH